MELSIIIPHLEALVFASEKPLSTLDLTDLLNNALGFIEDRASLDQVESALDAIREKYQSEFYPFEVKQSGGGWQFLTKSIYHKTVAQLNGDKFLKRLSTAALETLSIIAYKQPITKGEIESIRGVNCDYAVQKLLEKELIVITGRKENAPGQPLVYATSKNFMDYFGINSPEDLPKLSDIVRDQSAEATIIGEGSNTEEDSLEPVDNTFVVNEHGDIEELQPVEEGDLENEDTAVPVIAEETEDTMTETELDEAVILLEQEQIEEIADETVDIESAVSDEMEHEMIADQLSEENEGLTDLELDEAVAEIEHMEEGTGEDAMQADTGEEMGELPDDENKQKPDEEAGGSQL